MVGRTDGSVVGWRRRAPLLYVTLIVESRQFGGGSSLGLMTSFLQLCFVSIDGVVNFLHRERRHTVLWLVVTVLVVLRLRR